MRPDEILSSFFALLRTYPAIAALLALCAVAGAVAFVALPSGSQDDGPVTPALTGSWIKVKLAKRVDLTHNTALFRFALPGGPKQPLGLPIGHHIRFRAIDANGDSIKHNDTVLSRSYTPVSTQDTKGYVDFVIKIYPDGAFTQWLNKLPQGGYVMFYGPMGRFAYTPNQHREVGMIAGGTGITPMFQIIQAVLTDPEDRTVLSLVFANVSEEDILLRKELEAFAESHPGRFRMHHVLNRPPEGWQGSTGFVTADIIKAHLPAPGEDVKVLRCGPLPMMQAMKKALDGLGYAAESQFEF